MNKPKSQNNLDLLISQLPADLQRAALHVLNEWGYPLPGEDSFPVKLALLTRLQLAGFTSTVVHLANERVAITEATAKLAQSLAEEKELRASFLRAMRIEEQGCIERVRGQVAIIDMTLESVSHAQKDFLERIEKLSRRLPAPSDIAVLAKLTYLINLPGLPDGTGIEPSFRSAAARMLRAARHLEQARRLPPFAPQVAPPAPPKIPPIPPVPSVPSVPSVRFSQCGRRRVAAAMLVFLTAFVAAWGAARRNAPLSWLGSVLRVFCNARHFLFSGLPSHLRALTLKRVLYRAT